MERPYSEENSTAMSPGPPISNAAAHFAKAAAALQNAAKALSEASDALYASSNTIQSMGGDTSTLQPVSTLPPETTLAPGPRSEIPKENPTTEVEDANDIDAGNSPEETDYYVSGESLLGM